MNNEKRKILEKCPVCGREIEDVAYAQDYVIKGCPEHREFDTVISMSG